MRFALQNDRKIKTNLIIYEEFYIKGILFQWYKKKQGLKCEFVSLNGQMQLTVKFLFLLKLK